MQTKGSFLRSAARTALMSALLCVCAWITVPAPVPFTLQTFGVFAAVKLLGGKRGTVSVLLYLLLGAVGLPVFSGFGAGFGVLLGPTGGYLTGFLLLGLLSWLAPFRGTNLFTRNLIPAAGLLLCYLAGTAQYCLVTGRGFGSALTVCVLPFVLPDLLKLLLADFVSERIKRYENRT